MQITRNSTETGRGPSDSDWFSGTVYIDGIAVQSNRSRISASSVHFTPGVRAVALMPSNSYGAGRSTMS